MIYHSYYYCYNIVPSGSPQQFSGSSPSSSSITLSWDPPSADQQNGVIISYILSVTSLDTNVMYNYTVYGTQFSIPGLVPFSTYSCRIAAQTTIGTGPFTISVTVVTLEDGLYAFILMQIFIIF